MERPGAGRQVVQIHMSLGVNIVFVHPDPGSRQMKAAAGGGDPVVVNVRPGAWTYRVTIYVLLVMLDVVVVYFNISRFLTNHDTPMAALREQVIMDMDAAR